MRRAPEPSPIGIGGAALQTATIMDRAALDVLQVALPAILPPGAAFAVHAVIEPIPILSALESQAAQTMAPPRRLEFAWGRVCARDALAQFGLTGGIARGPDRAPVWPAPVVGSISHSNGFAAAAVCRRPPVIGLGLDIETATALDADLISRIVDDDEIARGADDPVIAKLLFSAKESIFKCLWPLTTEFLEFRDVSVTLSPSSSTFRFVCRRTGPSPLLARRARGAYARAGSLLATVVWIPGSDTDGEAAG